MPFYAEKNRWREGSPLISLTASSFPSGGGSGSPYGVPKGPRFVPIGGIGINGVETNFAIMTLKRKRPKKEKASTKTLSTQFGSV